MPLRVTAGVEGQQEKKKTPGRKGPCGLLRRDYSILGEKEIRGHSGGNDWQRLTAGGGNILERRLRSRTSGQESVKLFR